MKRITEWGKEAVYHFLAYVAAGILVGSLLTGAAKYRDKAEAKDREKAEAKDTHELYGALHRGSDGFKPMWTTPGPGASWQPKDIAGVEMLPEGIPALEDIDLEGATTREERNVAIRGLVWHLGRGAADMAVEENVLGTGKIVSMAEELKNKTVREEFFSEAQQELLIDGKVIQNALTKEMAEQDWIAEQAQTPEIQQWIEDFKANMKSAEDVLEYPNLLRVRLGLRPLHR